MQWLYFDLGWTLIDEMPAHRHRARLVSADLGRRGVAVTEDEFIELCFRCGRVDARSPFRAAVSTVAVAAACQDLPVPYEHARECIFAGAREMLAQLAMRHRLGVIANQSAGTEDRLRRFGIRDYFEVVLSSTELGIAKPDPRIFAEAERRAGVGPGELLMIGDRLDNDIHPARARGWRTIRVRQGFSKDQTSSGEADRPDAEIPSITDLPHALEKFRSASVLSSVTHS